MWARIQHEKWNKEVANAKKQTIHQNRNVEVKHETESNNIQAKLWLLQKMTAHSSSSRQGHFFQNLCKNTEFNQFK